MASAYHAPLCAPCAALIQTSLSCAAPRLPELVPTRFLSRVSGSDVPHFSITVAKKPRSCTVACSFSNAPEVITACNWNEAVLCSDVPVVVEFWASWCGPCKMVSRVIDEIAREYAGKIKCCRINADDHPQVAASHGIEKVPTVLLFNNAEKVNSFTGTMPKSVYVTAIEKSLSR